MGACELWSPTDLHRTLADVALDEYSERNLVRSRYGCIMIVTNLRIHVTRFKGYLEIHVRVVVPWCFEFLCSSKPIPHSANPSSLGTQLGDVVSVKWQSAVHMISKTPMQFNQGSNGRLAIPTSLLAPTPCEGVGVSHLNNGYVPRGSMVVHRIAPRLPDCHYPSGLYLRAPLLALRYLNNKR